MLSAMLGVYMLCVHAMLAGFGGPKHAFSCKNVALYAAKMFFGRKCCSDVFGVDEPSDISWSAFLGDTNLPALIFRVEAGCLAGCTGAGCTDVLDSQCPSRS